MAEGGNCAGMSFIEVGGKAAEIALTEVTVTGYEGDISSGFEIQVLNDLGVALKQYVWHDFTKKKVKYYGWYNATDGIYVKDMEEPVVFPAGKGFWLNTTAETAGLKLQCSGQVITQGQVIPLSANGQMIANPYPTFVKLANVACGGYGDEISSGLELQILDGLGVATKQFVWHDFTKKKVDYYGWYNATDGKYLADMEDKDNYGFAANKGFWAVCTLPDGVTTCTWTLNFPGIIEEEDK